MNSYIRSTLLVFPYIRRIHTSNEFIHTYSANNTRVQVRVRTGAQRAPYQSMRVQVRAVQTAGNALTVNTRTAHVRVRTRTGTGFAVGCIR